MSPRIRPAREQFPSRQRCSSASPARGTWRALSILAVAFASIWIGAASAQAQGLSDRADRPDRPVLRGEIDGKTSSEKSTDKDFTIGVDLPLRHSSSVASASVDSIVENHPDRHVTPDVYLKWSHQYD